MIRSSYLLYLTVSVIMAASSSAHRFVQLSSTRTKSVVGCNTLDGVFDFDLPHILKERVVDTPGHREVQEHILSRLEQLGPRWEITQDTFNDTTPLGEKTFNNIIATLDPRVDQRLILAAHYDSKYFADGHFRNNAKFLGATDSALPCALLLDLALMYNEKLQDRKLKNYSLQLIFFDGEEAFRTWTATDSIYGARHLAKEMAEDGGLLHVGSKTGLAAIEYFVLLDLIGAERPLFYDNFVESSAIFQRLVKIERRLHDADLLTDHSSHYFVERRPVQPFRIEDDHIPFLRQGVWHTPADNKDALHKATVSNLRKIFVVFLHEYFHLK